MKLIIYPSFDLFVYQLAEGLGADEDKVRRNKEEFLKNVSHLPSENHIEISQEFDRAQPDKLLDKLKDFDFSASQDKYTISGYYTPVRLSDTYALLMASSVEDKDPKKEQPVSSFKALKSLAKKKQGNLGKTCILYGYLPPGEKSEELAKAIYSEFATDNLSSQQQIDLEWQQQLTWDRQTQEAKPGKFLGADLFYLLHHSSPSDSGTTEKVRIFAFYLALQSRFYKIASLLVPDYLSSLATKTAILIILYKEADENHSLLNSYADLYPIWFKLFWFQNKILWASEQARQIKELLKDNFSQVSQTFRDIKKQGLELPELQKILERDSQTVAVFAINLNYLEIQQRTIEINAHSYDRYRAYLEEQARKICSERVTDLSCLGTFTQLVREQYQEQVKSDYDSIKPGLEALEKTIAAVNSLAALKQGDRDRRIEHLIAAVGVGVGSASAGASAVSALIKDFTPFYPIKVDAKQFPWAEPLSNLTLIFLLSIILGWGLGKYTWNKLEKHR